MSAMDRAPVHQQVAGRLGMGSPSGSPGTSSSRRTIAKGESSASQVSELSQANSESSEATGYVCMKEAFGLPPEAFEINDRLARDATGEFSRFAFRREVRGSVLIRLGMAPTPAREQSGGLPNTEDVYTKTSDKFAEQLYMAMMLGVGTFDLSKAMARCGYIAGIAILLCLSATHLFLCHRLSELPHHLRVNLETYGDMAKECLNYVGYKVVNVLVAMSWFGTCAIYLTECLKAVDTVYGCGAKIIGDQWKVLLGFAVLPLVFRTNAKSLRRASTVSLCSMFAIGGVEIVAAIFHGLMDLFEEGRRVTHVAVPFDCADDGNHGSDCRIDFPRIGKGATKLVLCFTGLAALPYIVSEMTQPHNAKKMTLKAWKKITAFQVAIAVFCYFGWGDDMVRRGNDPLSEILAKSEREPEGSFKRMFFRGVAVTMCWLLQLKTVATFPLYFWPLCRELGAAPRIEMQLQLPWAVRQAQFMKNATRVAMWAFALVPCFLDDYSFFKTFTICGPNIAVNFAFPAVFAFIGILSHKSVQDIPRRASQWARGAPRKDSAIGALRAAAGGARGAPRALEGRTDEPGVQIEMSVLDEGRAATASTSRLGSGMHPPSRLCQEEAFLFNGSMSMHVCATAVLALFTIVFFGFNMYLGFKKLTRGHDERYGKPRQYEERENCTPWFHNPDFDS